MKNNNLVPDSKLSTVADMMDRLATIRRNRDTECSKGRPKESAASFTARQRRIAKLTEREGALLKRLNDAKKGI